MQRTRPISADLITPGARAPRLLLTALVLLAPSAAPGEVPSETRPGSLDVTTYGLVIQDPGMNRIEPRSFTYGIDGAAEIDARLYLPADSAEQPLPVVVFVNGGGAPIQDWAIYRDWARFVASQGLAAVTADSADGRTAALLEALLARLRQPDLAQAVDSDHVALWAGSGNVPTALQVLERRPHGVRAAVLYYGSGTAEADLPHDLPVFSVLAGRDNPQLNANLHALWRRATDNGWPWTMVQAPDLMHAFDALDYGPESRRIVRQTVDFLRDRLLPGPPAPAPSLARQVLQGSYAQEWSAAAEALNEMHLRWPDEPEIQEVRALALLRAGRPEDALSAVRAALAAHPESARLRQVLGETFLALDRPGEAALELARARELGAGPPVTNLHGLALLRANRFREAAEAYAALAEFPGWTMPAHYNRACALAQADQIAAAIEALEAAVAAGYANFEHMRQDPDLAPLRGHARFEALVRSGTAEDEGEPHHAVSEGS